MPPTSAYWPEVGLGIMLFSFFMVGWTFHPCREQTCCLESGLRDLVVNGPITTSFLWASGLAKPVSAFWRIVLVMGVYTVFDVFGSLFNSSISFSLSV